MDTGSLLGVTWGLLAGWTGWKLVYHVGFALYLDERWHQWKERDERIMEFQNRMSGELFAAMRDAGIIEEFEETIH